MQIKTLAIFAAVSAGTACPGVALAFDHGCGGLGRAVACYEKVRLPDVYATHLNPVLLRPAFSMVYRARPIVGMRARRIEIAPARWETVHRPAVYGERMDRVLVSPAKTRYVDMPAETRTVRETMVVKPASVRWEHHRGFLGHGERLCKVVIPAETREVTREVMVSLARRVAEVTPAVYETRARSVLIAPASTARVYRPAIHGWKGHSVVLRPSKDYLVSQPAVVGTRYEQAFVRSGGYAWQRAGEHRW